MNCISRLFVLALSSSLTFVSNEAAAEAVPEIALTAITSTDGGPQFHFTLGGSEGKQKVTFVDPKGVASLVALQYVTMQQPVSTLGKIAQGKEREAARRRILGEKVANWESLQPAYLAAIKSAGQCFNDKGKLAAARAGASPYGKIVGENKEECFAAAKEINEVHAKLAAMKEAPSYGDLDSVGLWLEKYGRKSPWVNFSVTSVAGESSRFTGGVFDPEGETALTKAFATQPLSLTGKRDAGKGNPILGDVGLILKRYAAPATVSPEKVPEPNSEEMKKYKIDPKMG